jgi:crotonobetainyl-CoA:carnitine CoA-transferase CaiB-like acyl-CoA transferase
MIAQAEHATLGAIRLLGVPVKLSETPGSIRMAPPTLGQHTDSILRDDLDLSAADIESFRERGAI